MIAQLHGTILESDLQKDTLSVVVDVHGVGYEVFMTKASDGRFQKGHLQTIYVSESVTAYDGVTTLYGFLTREEKDFFNRIRENVGGMGPKKALECLDKITKSLPDFKRAIIDSDVRLLVSVFGFTKKTAEKLVFSLKGKVEGWSVSGLAKWSGAMGSSQESDAVSGLVNMGYRDSDAREMVAQAKEKLGANAAVDIILREALKLGGRAVLS